MPDGRRGEVWLAELDPTRGHEQAGTRPVLVVSDDAYNRSRTHLVVIVPITSRWRGMPLHVLVDPPEGGLTVTSTILCEGVRSVAAERLLVRWGRVEAATMAAVDGRLRRLLAL